MGGGAREGFVHTNSNTGTTAWTARVGLQTEVPVCKDTASGYEPVWGRHDWTITRFVLFTAWGMWVVKYIENCSVIRHMQEKGVSEWVSECVQNGKAARKVIFRHYCYHIRRCMRKMQDRHAANWWTEGWMDRRTGEWSDEWIDGWIGRLVSRWMYKKGERVTNGWQKLWCPTRHWHIKDPKP